MSNYLYITTDSIGTPTGGGVVTSMESEALKDLKNFEVGKWSCDIWSRANLEKLKFLSEEPWKWDDALYLHRGGCEENGTFPKLVHLYAGTFGKTVRYLKSGGSKICWTIAAHDRFVSRREFEQVWGIPFPFPHLTEEHLWQRYIEGYRQADTIICPSKIAADIVRAYGPEFKEKQIEVIPHGCTIPNGAISPPPHKFTVGYLGAISPDKGIPYLLQAWKKLGYRDSVLVLAGRDSSQPWVSELIHRFGGGNIICKGWVENVADFYSQISLLVQPSATEGFGIEVLEAMAHGRPVLCSRGAGAADVNFDAWNVRSCNTDELATQIEIGRGVIETSTPEWFELWKEKAKNYTWDKIKQMYIKVWSKILGRE